MRRTNYTFFATLYDPHDSDKCWVECHCWYEPGQEGNRNGHPDNWTEAFPPELELLSYELTHWTSVIPTWAVEWMADDSNVAGLLDEELTRLMREERIRRRR